MEKKLKLSEEMAYLMVIVIQALGVCFVTASDFGLSPIVAPAYIISLKVEGLTFGQAEWITQGALFLLSCILLGRIKLSYFMAFGTAVFYGAVLDVWRYFIPLFNPAITPPGAESFGIPLRIVFFVIGSLLIQFTVALCYYTYVEPMVYDFFTVRVSDHFKVDRTKFKRVLDFCAFVVCLTLSFTFFRKIRGIGIGSVILVFVNGIMIGFFDRLLERNVAFSPRFKALKEKLAKL